MSRSKLWEQLVKTVILVASPRRMTAVLGVRAPTEAAIATPLCPRSAGEYTTCGIGRGNTGLPFLSSSGNWLEVCENKTRVTANIRAAIAKEKIFLFTNYLGLDFLCRQRASRRLSHAARRGTGLAAGPARWNQCKLALQAQKMTFGGRRQRALV